MKEYVLGFVVDPESRKILLVRRNGGMQAWEGKWNGVSGQVRVLPGAEGEEPKLENPQDAMSRKAEEEAGLRIPPGEWQLRAVLRGEGKAVYVFLAFANIFVARGRPGGHQPLFYDSLAHWDREPVVPTLKWLVPLVMSPDLRAAPEVEIA